jgi:hypothetical protein
LPLGALPLLERFLKGRTGELVESPQAVTSLPKNAPRFVRATGFPASRGKSAIDVLLGPQKVALTIDNLLITYLKSASRTTRYLVLPATK